jgi:invasion protein IalB
MQVAPLLALLLWLFGPGTASARETETTYGAWTLRCDSVPGFDHQGCVMLQSLVLKTGGQPVLQFAIARPPGDGKPTVLVSLPLGIALPPGISIRIDDGRAANFPVERCEPDGCRAGMILREATIAQLARGKQLTITFYDGSHQPIDVPLSLDGFAESFAALSAPH